MRAPVWTLLAAAFSFGCGASGQDGHAPSAQPRAASAPTRGAPAFALGPGAATTDVSSIIGKPAPTWDLPTWINTEPLTPEALRGRVVLVRWFMSAECPYCSATAPSLVRMHDTYGPRGLTVVGMYHHKSAQPLALDDVRSLVRDHYHFEFPVAIDDGWKTLDRWWLTDHPDSWTSVSFILDRSGTVRFAHLGGEYAPGSADEKQMTAWIEQLLAEPVAH